MGPSGTSRVKRLLGGHSLQEGNGGKSLAFAVCKTVIGKTATGKVEHERSRNRFGKKISCQGIAVWRGSF